MSVGDSAVQGGQQLLGQIDALNVSTKQYISIALYKIEK